MVKTTEHKAYGQLNGFFRLNIRDPCLSGIMLASITGRRFYNTSTRKRLTPPCQASLDIVPLINSFDSNYVFISTADIYPTEIAVLPLAQIKEEWLPIKLPIKDIQQNQWYAGDPKKLMAFVMVTLHPEKLSLRPESTWHRSFYASSDI